MPIDIYGVLKGRAVDRRPGVHQNAHYQIHMVDDDTSYRVAVNVRSKLSPSELEFLIDENFEHPILDELVDLDDGFTTLNSSPEELALDYIRGNLFDKDKMTPLPFDVPGPDNDLNEAIDRYILRALNNDEARLYAFGEPWGPDNGRDKIFGFTPKNGIHNIHMNQGNVGRFIKDDGVWQDGALFIHFRDENRWVAIFLKFQSQTWHTDDTTGHRITTPAVPGLDPVTGPSDKAVRIIAALPNPQGPSPEEETVTILNTTPQDLSLDGWAILDKRKNAHPLDGSIKAGQASVIHLGQDVQLSNRGGVITLLDNQGLKVDGVSYTKSQAQKEGWTIIF